MPRILVLLSLVLVGCPLLRKKPDEAEPAVRGPAPEPEPAPEPAPKRRVAADDTGEPPGEPAEIATVRVFYGTDREAREAAAPNKRYGMQSARRLELGVAEVSIPPGHRMGRVERPSIWKLQFRENPEKHIVLTGLTPRPEDAWLAEIKATSVHRAFIYVPGFRSDFAEAARRTGQIAWDLDYDGLPLLYSWASSGTLDGYRRDEMSWEQARPHLRRFLTLAVEQGGITELSVVAHSMGNRLVASVLQDMASDPESPRLDQLVLAAPDIDARHFREHLAGVLPGLAGRVTLYISSRDRALALSRNLHDGPRAGEPEGGLLGLGGIDTIDASAVSTDFMGHDYYAESDTLLTDLHCLLGAGTPPERRPALRPVWDKPKTWWVILNLAAMRAAGKEPAVCHP
jgi:esterase/lipase superfamily enzyme